MRRAQHVTDQQKAAARVLLAADECLAREAITEALDGAGLSISRVATAEAALHASEASPGPPPAVLVTDTDIPAGGMDGLALAGAARRRWPNLGVVYLTGRPSRLDGHVLGARDRFLPRPVAPDALVRAVRGLLIAPTRRAA
jgi:DNA-binding response OmpR family regulator